MNYKAITIQRFKRSRLLYLNNRWRYVIEKPDGVELLSRADFRTAHEAHENMCAAVIEFNALLGMHAETQ